MGKIRANYFEKCYHILEYLRRNSDQDHPLATVDLRETDELKEYVKRSEDFKPCVEEMARMLNGAGYKDGGCGGGELRLVYGELKKGTFKKFDRLTHFYLSLSLNEQMLWLYEEIEKTIQAIKTNPEHEARQIDAHGSCCGNGIDWLFGIIKEDPKNSALLREIERAEQEWRAYVDRTSDAPSADEILTYWKQYMWAFCAEWDEQSQVLYFLMRGYDVCHDGDEWLGMYHSIWKLQAAYQRAVRELEEKHQEYGAREWTVTHERVMIHAFDQTLNRWKYDIPYEILFPSHELPPGIEIPQFLKTVEDE